MKLNKLTTKAFTFLSVLSVGACVTTNLTLEPPSKDELRLAATNQTPVLLSTVNSLSSSTVGHQYLFIFFPLGVVRLSDAAEYLRHAAFKKLALYGYRPAVQQLDPSGAVAYKVVPTVRIELSELQVSAYDLLFVRRLVCSIVMRGALFPDPVSPQPRREWYTRLKRTSYASYGFAPQLKKLLDQTMDEALDDLISHLRN